jgi:hypothetical protein
MKSTMLFFIGFYILSCSSPTSNINKISVVTCLNGNAYAIRYGAYPQEIRPEYFTNEIMTNNWATIELQFNLHDSLKSISFSPNRNDTLYFDTIWVEDTNLAMKIYTFESVTTYDILGQLALGATFNFGSSVVWNKIDNNTIEFYQKAMNSDTTYSADIMFMHPIISNGLVKIKLKANHQ